MQYSLSEFKDIYTRCFAPAMRLAMSLMHDEDEARDIVHDVFLKLWETDTPIDNPAAFAIRAVRNACLNRIDRLDTREKIRLRLALETDGDDSGATMQADEVRKAVADLLTPRQQLTIEKVYTEGLSYKEAAASMGVSVAAVNKNIVAALKKLRIHFKTDRP